MTKTIEVLCLHCQMKMDENKVKFLNIAEDEFGRDELTFICPICETKQKSWRYG